MVVSGESRRPDPHPTAQYMAHFDSFTSLLIGLPVLHASVFCHELGHAAIGTAVGFEINSFGLGTARARSVIAPRGIRIYFGLVRPFQGLTFAYIPQIFPSRARLVWFAAGGILFNAMLAILSIVLWCWLPWGSPVWLDVAAINGLLGGVSLIPIRFRIGSATMRTDGALIRDVLRSGGYGASFPAIIAMVGFFRGLWRSIGDTTSLRIYLWNAAAAWVALEVPGQAELLEREAESLPGDATPAVRGFGSLQRGVIALGTGRLAEAGEALDAAESYYRSTKHDVGLLLVAATRASARRLGGDAAGAAADLDALMLNPLAGRHPEIGIGLLVTRLAASADLSDAAGTRRLLARYEAVRPVRHPAPRDLAVYKAMANLEARQGDWTAAEPAYRRAFAAISELANDLPGEDRARFLEGQSALFEEAHRCLQALGKPDEAEQLRASLVLPPPAGFSPERDRRFRRWGLRIMLASLVSVLSATVIMALTVPRSARPLFGIVILFALLGVPGAFYYAIDLAVARLAPARTWSGGFLILILACLPWIVLILLPAVVLLALQIDRGLD
jgi:tetratricopeptide (TPR) repeat protein